MTYELHNGDCLDVMRAMDANSVDTIVCDPPYALTNRTPDVKWCIDCNRVLGGRDGKPDACPKCGGQLEYQRSQGKRGFMGKEWDTGRVAFEPAIWAECLRVAKPGAMLLAFGGTRTHHRLMCAIEDAGWEIRDVIMWLYGSGFPKSHDISKAIDKAAGAEREVVGYKASHRPNRVGHNGQSMASAYTDAVETLPATPEAAQWQGWGTALKPAYEPVILAMKPLDGTFAQNAEKHGVAGLNIDGARIGTEDDRSRPPRSPNVIYGNGNGTNLTASASNPSGRWPANLILDEEAAEGHEWARYFYTAKASRREREAGLEGMEEREVHRYGGGIGRDDTPTSDPNRPAFNRNNHPTVKPLSLMRYLVRLTATPAGGVVLDPFMGSGTTGIAAILEGRKFIGIELDADYSAIAEKRIASAVAQPALVAA